MKPGRSPLLGLLAVLALTILSHGRSDAALTIAFSQSGADVVITATGTLNLSGMSASETAETVTGEPFLYQQIAGNIPQDIVRLLHASFAIYRMPVGTNIFSNQFGVLVASGFTGRTFGIWADNSQTTLYVPIRFRSGSLEGSMVFEDVDLDDLGIIEQEINFGTTDDKKVKIAIVPEPAPLSLLGLGGSVMVLRRSRRM